MHGGGVVIKKSWIHTPVDLMPVRMAGATWLSARVRNVFGQLLWNVGQCRPCLTRLPPSDCLLRPNQGGQRRPPTENLSQAFVAPASLMCARLSCVKYRLASLLKGELTYFFLTFRMALSNDPCDGIAGNLPSKDQEGRRHIFSLGFDLS